MHKRNLVALSKQYNMEFLYLSDQARLPANFFPFANFKIIAGAYDKKNISQRRMHSLLTKLFKFYDRIDGAIYFSWNQDLTNFYSKIPNVHRRMFFYKYDKGHKLFFNIYRNFKEPKGFEGLHPQLLVTYPQKEQMTLLWKISPKSEDDIQKGFPVFIMDKRLFGSVKPIVSYQHD